MAKYAFATIISLALCESIGIYGLVLYILGSNFKTFYGLIIISALGMFYYRPREEELNVIYQEFKRDSF